MFNRRLFLQREDPMLGDSSEKNDNPENHTNPENLNEDTLMINTSERNDNAPTF